MSQNSLSLILESQMMKVKAKKWKLKLINLDRNGVADASYKTSSLKSEKEKNVRINQLVVGHYSKVKQDKLTS